LFDFCCYDAAIFSSARGKTVDRNGDSFFRVAVAVDGYSRTLYVSWSYAKISSVSGFKRKLLQALKRIGQFEMATICGISARNRLWRRHAQLREHLIYTKV
jgi:hypothetical protein